ncbi:MAG: winged helix-turn-helix transcriptional regulator [Candidatus Thorarchaeota archaeon]
MGLLFSLLLILSIFHFLPLLPIFQLPDKHELFNSPVCSANIIKSLQNEGTDVFILMKERIPQETPFNLPLFLIGKWSSESSSDRNEFIPVNRTIIKATIRQNPGITLREIQRKTDLAIGVIQYHLGRLEATEIEAFMLGKCKHLFLKQSNFSLKEKMWFAVLRNKSVRAILQYLESNTNDNLQKDIVNSTGISKVMVSYYVKQLEQFGIIRRKHHQLSISEDYLDIITKLPNCKIS